jgi:hypothetical protein
MWEVVDTVALWWIAARGAPAMTTDNECFEYARECVRLAGLTKDEVLRDQLLNWLASGWLRPCTRPRCLMGNR